MWSGVRRAAGDVLREALSDAAFYEDGGGLTLTGGEPLLQPAFAEALLRLAKAERLNTAIETTGNAPWETIEAVSPYVDLWLFDLKHMDSPAHRKWTGLGNELILSNLRRLAASGAPIRVRMPLIPEVNSSEDNLRRTGEFVAGLGGAVRSLDLLPYHKLARAKYEALGQSRQVLRCRADAGQPGGSRGGVAAILQTHGASRRPCDPKGASMLATMTETGCTARVSRLRERILDTTPSVCAERGLLVTEAHQRYAADPPVLRRAKALAHVLDHMTIRIDEGELIVGNQASAPRAAPLFPEYEADFLVNEVDEFAHRRADVYTVSADVKRAILEEIGPYWRGNTLYDHAQAMRPAEVTQAEQIGAISGRGNISSGDGHIIMNIPKVLRQGLAGVLNEVRAASAAVSPVRCPRFQEAGLLQSGGNQPRGRHPVRPPLCGRSRAAGPCRRGCGAARLNCDGSPKFAIAYRPSPRGPSRRPCNPPGSCTW